MGGRLRAAEQIYRQVLSVDANQPDALHLLGVIAHQAGRHDEAAASIERAIRLNRAVPDYHYNLGNVHQALRRFPEAAGCYRQTLELKPDFAQAYNGLGSIFAKQGSLEEAAVCFHRALEFEPDFLAARANLGSCLLDQGKVEAAVDCYRRVLQAEPNFAEAHNNLGRAFRAQGKLDDAIASCRRALELSPNLAGALHNLGLALGEQGRPDEAIGCYRGAIAMAPGLADAHYDLGRTLTDHGKLEEAVACYRRVLALEPARSDAHNGMGVALGKWGELEEAVACFRQALNLKPDFTEAHNNLGNALSLQGELEAAVACFRQALAISPNADEIHRNLGCALLRLGRYDDGWREYEHRLRIPASRKTFSQPRWNGERAEGRTILIHSEQGFGDTLQFVRYAPLVCARVGARRVILGVQPALARLLIQNGCWNADVVSSTNGAETELPPFDCHVPLVSLPLALGLSEPPAVAGGYLHADPALRQSWRERLGAAPAPRVGLVWAGNPVQKEDRFRSMPDESYLPLLQMRGIQFYSLQMGSPSRRASALQEAGLIDLTAHIRDFADTAALVAEMDLIITVDTAVAHLAGAMGRPVWTLLRFAPYWPWGPHGDSTGWYPGMRLFRQPRRDDWASVLQRVGAELRAFA